MSTKERPLKHVDLLRHELKALRYILDKHHSGRIAGEELPAREDFTAAQSRAIYDVIVRAKSRAAAEEEIGGLELDDVDIESFLRLSGDHYYAYPALVRERAALLKRGDLSIEAV